MFFFVKKFILNFVNLYIFYKGCSCKWIWKDNWQEPGHCYKSRWQHSSYWHKEHSYSHRFRSYSFPWNHGICFLQLSKPSFGSIFYKLLYSCYLWTLRDFLLKYCLFIVIQFWEVACLYSAVILTRNRTLYIKIYLNSALS